MKRAEKKELIKKTVLTAIDRYKKRYFVSILEFTVFSHQELDIDFRDVDNVLKELSKQGVIVHCKKAKHGGLKGWHMLSELPANRCQKSD